MRRCWRAYRERRDALVAELTDRFPGTTVSGIAAGLHVIARLPERYGPEPSFMRRANAAGVALRPLSDCETVPSGSRTVDLLLGHAHLTPHEIT